MRLREKLALTTCLAIGLGGAASAAPMFMALGDLPGGSFGTIAYAISADGSTVVGQSQSGVAAGKVKYARSPSKT